MSILWHPTSDMQHSRGMTRKLERRSIYLPAESRRRNSPNFGTLCAASRCTVAACTADSCEPVVSISHFAICSWSTAESPAKASITACSPSPPPKLHSSLPYFPSQTAPSPKNPQNSRRCPHDDQHHIETRKLCQHTPSRCQPTGPKVSPSHTSSHAFNKYYNPKTFQK
jgi:hypothetical protein